MRARERVEELERQVANRTQELATTQDVAIKKLLAENIELLMREYRRTLDDAIMARAYG